MRTHRGISLTYGLLETLGQSIVIGDFDKDGFPTEAELCAKFGASRTVAREAVKMLTAKGLLSARPRQGTKVEPITQWNLLDPDVTRWLMERQYSNKIYREFTEVRLAIEPVAAALAAQRANKADIRAIRDGLNGMRDEAADHDAALLADIDFHVAILKASGNPFFLQLRALINTALRISIGLTNKISGHTASIPAHEAVLIAIENGDAVGAEKAMRAILLESLELLASFNPETTH
ncbi:FadR/GntR family transcriptional regulator [Asticcacaulis machinosus]|uniref:FadR/GntR family transcriptional regulator n=1 Tax=Asticcacaulis machinosus TaxID=2984211 RepID=A0ABT5HI73_9CAUL|nr:FadR/GntR family transcriptional regulator [Asticcacaulis machinosus]MDC7675947.1 FadR/GntR family transcriptional regulator [Asticcacaulis machinosus]